MDRYRRRATNDRGSITALMAILAVVIVGSQALFLDVLHVQGERWHLQTAVDAAAQAAGAHLPAADGASMDAAVLVALDYAARNGVPVEQVQVSFSTDTTPNDRVTVSASATVPLSLGRVFGIASTSTATDATVQAGELGALSGVLPWGITPTEEDLQFGQISCLKLASNDSTCSGERGSFNALDIDGTGSSSGSVYRDRIVTGSTVVVSAGTIVEPISGNMRGPTEQGVGCTGNDGRITGNLSTFEEVVVSNGGQHQVLDWTNTRIAVIPFVAADGAGDLVVTGFGAFFIEGCGDGGAVLGRFIRTVVPGGGWQPLIHDFGARAVRLVQ